MVIDAIGGTITSEALKAMAMGGSLVTLGYSAGRNTTIDVTDIIWKDLSVTGLACSVHASGDSSRVGRDLGRCL